RMEGGEGDDPPIAVDGQTAGAPLAPHPARRHGGVGDVLLEKGPLFLRYGGEEGVQGTDVVGGQRTQVNVHAISSLWPASQSNTCGSSTLTALRPLVRLACPASSRISSAFVPVRMSTTGALALSGTMSSLAAMTARVGIRIPSSGARRPPSRRASLTKPFCRSHWSTTWRNSSPGTGMWSASQRPMAWYPSM